jgi:tetratricopeptide (TPR) repeat protein
LAYEQHHDFDRAIADYDQALRLTPGDADAFCGRACAYAQKGDYDRAIQDYDQALRINPTYIKALANRRLAYAQKGDYFHAMADRNRLLLSNLASQEMRSICASFPLQRRSLSALRLCGFEDTMSRASNREVGAALTDNCSLLCAESEW